MTEFSSRLVAYEPAGARVGVLPSPLSAQASVVCNDAGALTATYSRLALRGEVLDRALSTGLEIAVEVTDHTGAWVEPAGARFVWVAREDDLADRAEVVKVAAPSWGWLLGRARLLDLEHLLPDEHSQAGKRPFYSASAGVILATLMQENAARGGVPVVAGFTTAADSAGQAWSQVATLYYEPGMDLRTIITNLADQGMCDWTTAGRTLRVYNTDTALAGDRASSVRLHLGRDVAEAPSSQSLEEVVSRVLLRGDDGLTLTLDNPEAPTPWGAWEGYLSQGGVSDASTATRLVQSELERRARTRAQYTRALILPGADVWPLVDYAPGDWITAPTDQPAERVRVQQVTLTLGADGVGGSLVLNDRILDAEIRRSRRMSGIVGGSQSDGGSGARPAPQGPDRRTPAAPLGLVVDSDAFIDTDGAARGLLDVDWGDVSTASDGTALEVAGYDVAVRENVTGAPWSVVQSVEASQAVVAPLQVGAVLQVKVRARGRFTTTPGLWSAVATVTVANDVTPPAVPSTPVASVDRAVVRVTWNGKTAAGGTMPRDFDRVEIASDAAPTVPVGTVLAAGGGFILVTGLAYGAPVRYRARAVDRSGNASAWTGYSAAVTPAPLVSEDIDATITAAIDANRADLDALTPTVNQAVTDLADARDRLDTAEDLVADAITIADGANDTSADAIAVAHAAQTAADLANAAASAAVQGAGNVVGPNWSFELGDFTGWRRSGGNAAIITATDAVDGTHVLQWTTAAAAFSVDNQAASDGPTVVAAPGQTWLARVRARTVGSTPATGRLQVYVRYYDGSSWTTPTGAQVNVSPAATWTTIEVQGLAPAGTLGVCVVVYGTADYPSGTVIQLDAVELRDWTQVKAALAAAATAQAAADTAHQAAGSAQDTADAAIVSASAAGTAAAQAAADAAAAQSTANGAATAAGNAATAAANVPKIYHSTNVPSGTAPQHSTWFQHRGSLGGEVIGQWAQTAAGIASTWVSSEIASEVIANLDVGKLTAGSGVIVDLVAQTIAGATAAFQRVDAKHIFSTGGTFDTVVAQEMWAAKVAVQKVLANEVIIGSTENLIPNAADLSGWTRAGGTTDVTWDTAKNALRVGGGVAGDDSQTSAQFPVIAGRTYACAADLYSDISPSKGVINTYCRVYWYRADGTASASGTTDWSANYDYTPGTWVTRDGVLTAPADAAWAQVRLYTWRSPGYEGTTAEAFWWRNITVRPRVDTALIVDGSVKARHVGAAEIEGYHVKTNTLTADNAVVGFLDGYVITGALIQTVSTVNRGVKISGDGLVAYNGSGQVTVQIDGTTATITSGVVRSSATPSAQDGGWQLDTANGLRFWASRSDGSIGQGARLYANGRAVFYKPDGTIGVQITNGTLSIADGMLVGAMLADGSVTGPKIAGNAVGSAQIAANAVGSTQIASGAVGTTQVAAGAVTRAKIGDNAVGTVQIANGAVTADLIAATAIDGKVITGATIQSGTSAVGTGSGIRLNGTGNNATLTVWSGSNDITLNPGGGQPYIRWERGTAAQYSAYAASSNRWTLWDNVTNGQVITASRSQFWAQGATAASTASVNCRVGSSGDLYTVTSLRAMKLLIEDAPTDWADAALALRPRTWLDKPSHDAYADYLAGDRDEPGGPVPLSTRIPGFVAEEVEAAAPFLCTYDEDGNLTGVQYDRVPAALVILAQRQQTQIDALTAQVAALTPEAA